MILRLKSSFSTMAVFLAVFSLATGMPRLCLAQTSSVEQLVRDGRYVEAIRSLDRKWRASGRLSPQEARLYVDAYYQYGKQLLENGDLTNAKASFLRVTALDRRHADGYFQLGILEKRSKNYEKALRYLRSAITLRSQHSPEANLAILEIGKESLSAAEQAMAEGQVRTARELLTFVRSNFVGEEKNKSLELVAYGLVPLERAAREYARATRLLTPRGKPEAVKILRGIAENYPGTFFARRANQLLQQLGEKIIVVRTSTGLQLPPAWRRKQTAHFDVYYEKEMFFNRIVPQAEKALPKIFASLGYAKPTWKERCKVYLFSSLSDWQKFLETNRGSVLEWSTAFAIPKAMEIYLYESNDTSQMLEHILPHELTHVVHHSIVGDLRHTPMWFQEGLAVSHEEGKPKEIQRTIRTLRRSNAYIPLRELVSSQGYPTQAERISIFYLESAALMNLLLHNFGPQKVRDMALAYRRPVSFEHVLRDVLRTTMNDLENLWKKYVE